MIHHCVGRISSLGPKNYRRLSRGAVRSKSLQMKVLVNIHGKVISKYLPRYLPKEVMHEKKRKLYSRLR